MTHWHSMEADQVLKELNSDLDQGLSREEVRKRLGIYGYNELRKEEPKRASFWSLSNILTLLLLLAALFSMLAALLFRISIRVSEIFKPQETAFTIYI